MATREADLGHREILLLEDEAIIAMDIEMTLESHGYTVVGPYASIAEARAALGRHHPAAAVMDVNLGGDEHSFALAEELRAAGSAVVFLSGYSPRIVPRPPAVRSAERLSKPVTEAELIGAIRRVTKG